MTYAEREARDLASKLGFEIGDENEVDLTLLQSAITRAMAHERERCATTAEGCDREARRYQIADEIRALPPEEVP